MSPILGLIDSSKTGNLTSPSMDFIATYEVPSGGVSQISFSSISQNYTHLHIRGVLRNEHPSYQYGSLYWQHNGTGQGQYHDATWAADPPSLNYGGAGGAGTPFGTVPTSNITSGFFSQWVLDMFEYKNTNKNKTVIYRDGFAASSYQVVDMGSASFANNLNATTSINFYSLTSNFIQYSRLSLYGIRGE
jgi:hypothetical protein